MEGIASIDFSINSTCVCILLDGNYTWHHFSREGMKHFDLGEKGFVSHVLPKRVQGSNYCSSERMKIIDAQILCSSITEVLKKNHITAIALEGHSFNSKGNSLLELASYQFLLRNMIIKEILEPERMFFYSPVTIKSFAGGARFKKPDMLNAFLSSEDQQLEKNPIYIKMKSQLENLIKKENVVKPIDDLVDSYWILKKLQTDV